MNIGLSTTQIEPCHVRGHIDGKGVYTSHLSDEFIKLGHTVTGYSFPPKSSSSELVRSMPFPGSFHALAGLGIVSRGLIRHDIPVDLMHFTDYLIFPVKCLAIATLHDAIPMKFPEMCNPKLRKLKNFILRSTAKYADHIITLSQASVPDIVKYYRVSEHKISVVGCGVSKQWLIEPESYKVDQVLQKYALHRGFFLFVGTFQPRKNIDRIINAYSKLSQSVRKERKLVLVGREGWACAETISKLKQLIIDGDAIWLNNIDDDNELRCIYAGADVFVFPSLYEGFGIPVLEAFSCGLPVITSNVSSLPEVSRQIGIEVDPTSLDEIVGAMQWLAQDEAERKRRAISGRKLAESITWDIVAQQTLNVYKKII
ncbi:MAG: glycosyltransferase family 4 protein [Syntrophaceae bacterium]|nr:glycosyltransferase family 4 protein [Syntrophaceae bacterium]